jgi:hypothetical protein
MRTTFGLASLTFVTGFCLAQQACSGENEGSSLTRDGGAASPERNSSSGDASAATSSSSGSTSSGGEDAGEEVEDDAGITVGKSKMTFFATSTGSGANGGNLGGIAGADKKCADLAAAVNGADHTWAAYLSITAADAKDRIGPGPWQNQKGVEIAKDVASLHAKGFNVKGADILDETGNAVPATEHDMLTGSNADGTKVAGGRCTNWTDTAGDAVVGHADSDTTAKNTTDRWNNAHTVACTAKAIKDANGSGRFYCFAKD